MNRVVGSVTPVEELLDNFLAAESLLEDLPAECGRITFGADLKRYTRSRLTEVSGRGGGAGLTFAFSLVREAQQRDDSVLWLSSALKPFYPPDAHHAGARARDAGRAALTAPGSGAALRPEATWT